MSDDERIEPLILVVDLETTGTDARDCSIIEFGAVWLTGAVGEFELPCRMWDGARIEPRALERNGCSEGRCTDPKLLTETEALDQFFTWLFTHTGSDERRLMLAGLNPSFDRAFLLKAWLRAKHPASEFVIPHRTIDLHTLAVTYALAKGEIIPSRGLYTDEIYAVLGLLPEPKPHRAINGARLEAAALRQLMGLDPVP